MRPWWILLAGVVLTVPASADEKPGQGRYAVEPSPDGFVRLDTETGAVSHCSRRADGTWYCDALIEDTGALTRQVEALSARVAALEQEVAALTARLPPPVAQTPPPAETPGFAQTLLQKLFGLVRDMKGGGEG